MWAKFRTTSQLKGLLQLRFDFDSTRQSGHHDSMLIHTRRHFTSEVWKRYINVDNRRMLPDVDQSAWMSFLLPWRTLLRHYMSRQLPSLLATTPLDATKKMNMFIFRRNGMEVESRISPERNKISSNGKGFANCNLSCACTENSSLYPSHFVVYCICQSIRVSVGHRGSDVVLWLVSRTWQVSRLRICYILMLITWQRSTLVARPIYWRDDSHAVSLGALFAVCVWSGDFVYVKCWR